MLDAATSLEVEAILSHHGLPSRDLSVSDGFSNLVVLAPDHVVRLNSGRFPGAFRHEARVLAELPVEIPKPAVVAHGTRSSGGEYLVLERRPGENLEQAWPKLALLERERLVREIGAIMRRIHEIPLAAWMHNPWVEDVLLKRRWRDAYHAPAETYPHLVASAASIRLDLVHLLTLVVTFIADRLYAFGEAPDTFVHTDLHFRNVVVDAGHVTGLIDFEGSRIGRRDAEADMLFRSLSTDDQASPSRYPGAMATLAEVYPELFSDPLLPIKLEVYEALWQLVQAHHWRPGHTWTVDPGQKLEALVSGQFAQRMTRVMHERGE